MCGGPCCCHKCSLSLSGERLKFNTLWVPGLATGLVLANETWVDIAFPFLSVQRLQGGSSFSSLFLLHRSRDHRRIRERDSVESQASGQRLLAIVIHSAQATSGVGCVWSEMGMSRKARDRTRRQERWHSGAWEDSPSHTELLPTEMKPLQVSLGQTPLCWPIQVPVHRGEAHLPLFLVQIGKEAYPFPHHTRSLPCHGL